MLQNIWQDVDRQIKTGNMITKLIIVNTAVFVAINLVRFVLFIGNGAEIPPIYADILNYLSIPTAIGKTIFQPWSIITHMFTHERFFHILINMLYLYWFGSILADMIGNRHVLPIYLFSGWAGTLFLWISAPLLYPGLNTYALGASAATMGIACATAAIVPDYEINLLLIGRVKLKYIVLVLILLDLIAIPERSNTGGHVAHLGGVMGGFFFIYLLRTGVDLSERFSTLLSRLNIKISDSNRKKKRSSEATIKPLYNDQKKTEVNDEERLNMILEKIKKVGRNGLSNDEKSFLDKMSSQL